MNLSGTLIQQDVLPPKGMIAIKLPSLHDDNVVEESKQTLPKHFTPEYSFQYNTPCPYPNTISSFCLPCNNKPSLNYQAISACNTDWMTHSKTILCPWIMLYPENVEDDPWHEGSNNNKSGLKAIISNMSLSMMACMGTNANEVLWSTMHSHWDCCTSSCSCIHQIIMGKNNNTCLCH